MVNYGQEELELVGEKIASTFPNSVLREAFNVTFFRYSGFDFDIFGIFSFSIFFADKFKLPL